MKTKLYSILLIISILSIFTFPYAAKAQSGQNTWSTPENLSNSGGTNDPRMVVDAFGDTHVIWTDLLTSMRYTKNDGGGWQPSTIVEFPFGPLDNPPVLVADANGRIHAFWTNALGTMSYSRALAETFGEASQWTTIQILAESALDMDVAVDQNGLIHLVYIRPISSDVFPAGVYYRQSVDGGATWSSATLLYQSNYFRSLPLEKTNVEIVTSGSGENSNLFVAWDDLTRRRVFLTRSVDSGLTWDDNWEVDGPLTTSVTETPFNSQVYANDDQALVVWQVGEPNSVERVNCRILYRFSDNVGQSWSNSQTILDEITGCPSKNFFIAGGFPQALLFSDYVVQSYLTAWDGTRWSNPQAQPQLINFTDPDSLIRANLDITSSWSNEQYEVSLLGMDKNGPNDVWFLNSQLESTQDWFPDKPSWNSPQELLRSEQPIYEAKIIAGVNNVFHAFWVLADNFSPAGTGNNIYYAQWSDGSWTTPVSIASSPEGIVSQIAAAVDEYGKINLVWSGGINGEIYYSWANPDLARLSREWTEPVRLSTPGGSFSSPSITVDNNGKVTVVFAKPSNKGRGLYITEASETGAEWTEPRLVFDAELADWERIDFPILAHGFGSTQFSMWDRLTGPDGLGSFEVYYSQTDLGGENWYVPEVATEKTTFSKAIVVQSDNTINRFWQEFNGSQIITWHEFSNDFGVTWVLPNSIDIFSDKPLGLATAVDSIDRIHLLQYAVDDPATKNPVLQHWVWAKPDWELVDNLSIDPDENLEYLSLSADVTGGNRLMTLFVSKTTANDRPLEYVLFSADELLDIPEEIDASPIITPAATPTPQITSSPTPDLESLSPTPDVTMTIDLSNPEFNQNIGRASNSQLTGIIIAGVLSLVTIVLVIFIGRRFNR